VKYVGKRYTGTSTTGRIFAWLGIKRKGPFEYYFKDADKRLTIFQPYPISPMVREWSYILRGSSDVTGLKFMPYMEALNDAGELDSTDPALNGKELIHHQMSAREGDPALMRLKLYDGNLNSDPNHWPEPYRSAYLSGH